MLNRPLSRLGTKHTAINWTLLSITIILSLPEIAPVAKNPVHEIPRSICLPSDRAPLARLSFSPQGNAQRSRSDFSVIELEDKLDLRVHPQVAWQFEFGPPTTLSFLF